MSVSLLLLNLPPLKFPYGLPINKKALHMQGFKVYLGSTIRGYLIP